MTKPLLFTKQATEYSGNSLMKLGNIRSVAGSVALLVASVSASGADLLSVYDQACRTIRRFTRPKPR